MGADTKVVAKTPQEQGLSLEVLTASLQHLLDIDTSANDLTVIAVDANTSYTINEVSADGNFVRLFVNYADPSVHPDS